MDADGWYGALLSELVVILDTAIDRIQMCILHTTAAHLTGDVWIRQVPFKRL